MSEIPLEGPEISLDQVEALGALEKAFEEALSQVPHPYVLSQLMAMFPKVMHPEGHCGARRDGLGRFHGRVQKVSVSMPEDLATAIRERTGPGGFSRYVTEAVERQLRSDGSAICSMSSTPRFGPVPPELLNGRSSAMAGSTRSSRRHPGARCTRPRPARGGRPGRPPARETAALGGTILVTAASTLAEVLRGGAGMRGSTAYSARHRSEIDKSAGARPENFSVRDGYVRSSLHGRRAAGGGRARAATSGHPAHQRPGRSGPADRGTGPEEARARRGHQAVAEG